jgi:hypothetical protein
VRLRSPSGISDAPSNRKREPKRDAEDTPQKKRERRRHPASQWPRATSPRSRCLRASQARQSSCTSHAHCSRWGSWCAGTRCRSSRRSTRTVRCRSRTGPPRSTPPRTATSACGPRPGTRCALDAHRQFLKKKHVTLVRGSMHGGHIGANKKWVGRGFITREWASSSACARSAQARAYAQERREQSAITSQPSLLPRTRKP